MANTHADLSTLVKKYEVSTLTKANTLDELNQSVKNTLDLKSFSSICELELAQKTLPEHCYLLNEKLASLGLVSEEDSIPQINSYDNLCLKVAPNIIDKEKLPEKYPKTMGKACVETIESQKKRLHYIFLGKNTSS